MVSRFGLVSLTALLIAALPSAASANGRPPGTSTINFRQGHESDIAVGLTFGLLISHDSGATWGWVCEDAVGYMGTYDPKYAFTAQGSLFATTFGTLRVARDLCSFTTADPATATTFSSTDTIGPDGTFYYAAAQGADTNKHIAADYNIYQSANGTTFSVTPGQPTSAPNSVSWWQSIVVAPSNKQTIYLTGYVFVSTTSGSGATITTKNQLMFRSTNAGTSWTAVPLTGVTVAPNSAIDIVGVSPDDDQHVYIRVELDDNSTNDSLYVSSNGGTTWTNISKNSKIKGTALSGFVVRAKPNSLGAGHHDLILGTQDQGAAISHDDGATWAALPTPPSIGCLVENSLGELWACTQNYGSSGIPGDGAGIMKTTDPTTGAWAKVLIYQSLTDAETCAAGSTQATTCTASWCAVCAQLGCTPPASYNCPVPTEAPTNPASGSGGGCCQAGPGGGEGALALAGAVGMLLLGRRPRGRRRPARHASP